MFKFRAKRRFRLHYFEHLLKGDESEVAADAALTETKAECRTMLDSDEELSESAKQRMWFDVLDDLVEWQALLIKIPIDRTELEKMEHQLVPMQTEIESDARPE